MTTEDRQFSQAMHDLILVLHGSIALIHDHKMVFASFDKSSGFRARCQYRKENSSHMLSNLH